MIQVRRKRLLEVSIKLLCLIFRPTVSSADGLTCPTKNKSFPQQIKQAILTDYDKYLRPVLNESNCVKVGLNPGLYTISDVNFAQQTLTLKLWFRMSWIDEHLTWDPAQFGNLTSVMVERSAIWLPDIFILDQTDIIQMDDSFYVVTLESNGQISSSVDQMVKIHCNFDVTDFPYDTQYCEFRASSWMYSSNEIDPWPNLPTDMDAYDENNEWILRNFSARRSTSCYVGVPYVDVYYGVEITRKPNYYISTFVWPSFLITCLSIIGIFSPFDAAGNREEKVSMGLTTLLTMAVILMIVTDQMPKSSSGLPMLGIFIMIEICLSALATLTAVGVMYLHSLWLKGYQVPIWLRLVLCCRRKNANKTCPVVRMKDASSSTIISNRTVQTTAEGLGTRQGSFANVASPRLASALMTVDDRPSSRDNNKEDLHADWSFVTHRLDLVLMGVFIGVNCLLVVLMFLNGNAKLSAQKAV